MAEADEDEKTTKNFIDKVLHADSRVLCKTVQEANETFLQNGAETPIVWINEGKPRTLAEWKTKAASEAVFLTEFSRPIKGTLWHGPINQNDVALCSSALYHDKAKDDIECVGFLLREDWHEWFEKITTTPQMTTSALIFCCET